MRKRRTLLEFWCTEAREGQNRMTTSGGFIQAQGCQEMKIYQVLVSCVRTPHASNISEFGQILFLDSGFDSGFEKPWVIIVSNF